MKLNSSVTWGTRSVGTRCSRDLQMRLSLDAAKGSVADTSYQGQDAQKSTRVEETEFCLNNYLNRSLSKENCEGVAKFQLWTKLDVVQVAIRTPSHPASR